MRPMSNPGPLISTAKAAKILGLSVRQVVRLVPRPLKPAAKGDGPRGAYFFTHATVMAEKRRRDDAALAEDQASA